MLAARFQTQSMDSWTSASKVERRQLRGHPPLDWRFQTKTMDSWNSASKMERRRACVLEHPPPDREGWALFRSDGAARGNGQPGGTLGGWGCAFFGTNAHGDAPEETQCSNGYLGTVADNVVAEYHGLIGSLQRAERSNYPKVCLQVDLESMAKQLNKALEYVRKMKARGVEVLIEDVVAWWCKRNDLRPLFCAALECVQKMWARGVEVLIEFIYREYNTVADKLANRAIDGMAPRPPRGYKGAVVR